MALERIREQEMDGRCAITHIHPQRTWPYGYSRSFLWYIPVSFVLFHFTIKPDQGNTQIPFKSQVPQATDVREPESAVGSVDPTKKAYKLFLTAV